MGHMVNPDKDYDLLQKHLDKSVTGAPNTPTFMKILHLLFTPEQAKLAQRIPHSPVNIRHLSKKLQIPEDELGGQITEMARQGLLLDMQFGKKRVVMLAPVVIGFFEYTFMRTRDDMPMKELAHLFELYMKEEGDLAKSVFQKQTQIGRSLLHEEAFPEGDFTEIMDWERATKVIETASAVAVSMCSCRHKHTHLGTACDAPLRACLTLNVGVAPLVNAGIATKIDTKEALRILDECKEAGLAQTGDNVKNGLTYMCNCCGCCCGMMSAIKTFNIKNAIVSSNWIMDVDLQKCKGCGKCAKACPIGAIEIKVEPVGDGNKKKRWAVVNKDLCLGCGVCYTACKFGSINMLAREKRVFTPEGVFDKTVAMAIERGKLADLIFSDPQKFSHKAMARILAALEHSSPYKAAMAIEPLKSSFLNAMVNGAKKMGGL